MVTLTKPIKCEVRQGVPHMLNDKKLDEFLSSSERNICDFKEYIYTLSTDDDKGKFIKDILCMVNTPRSESAFIIIGVKQANGKNYFRDVDLTVDENQFLTILISSYSLMERAFQAATTTQYHSFYIQ